MNRATYRALPPETRVEVLYNPGDATLSRLADRLRIPWAMLAVSGLGGLFVVVGLVLTIGGWEHLARASALRRRGQVTQGKLLDRWTQTDSDGDPE